MGVDERRRQQLALRVQLLVGRGVQAGRQLGDAAVLHRDGHAGAAVGQGGVGDQQVQHLRVSIRWDSVGQGQAVQRSPLR